MLAIGLLQICTQDILCNCTSKHFQTESVLVFVWQLIRCINALHSHTVYCCSQYDGEAHIQYTPEYSYKKKSIQSRTHEAAHGPELCMHTKP